MVRAGQLPAFEQIEINAPRSGRHGQTSLEVDHEGSVGIPSQGDLVSVGGRAFLPHFRSDAVRGVAVAIGVTAAPIARAGDPAPSARVVVLIVARRWGQRDMGL